MLGAWAVVVPLAMLLYVPWLGLWCEVMARYLFSGSSPRSRALKSVVLALIFTWLLAFFLEFASGRPVLLIAIGPLGAAAILASPIVYLWKRRSFDQRERDGLAASFE